MTRTAYVKPAATETPLRQLLGHGQIVTPEDYTPERLHALCKMHTNTVLRLQDYTRRTMPRSCLLADVNKLRAQADALNEQIDSDAFGGTGGLDDPFPMNELSAVGQKRVNLNLAAKRALKNLEEGLPGIAHEIVKAALVAVTKNPLDRDADDC